MLPVLCWMSAAPPYAGSPSLLVPHSAGAPLLRLSSERLDQSRPGTIRHCQPVESALPTAARAQHFRLFSAVALPPAHRFSPLPPTLHRLGIAMQVNKIGSMLRPVPLACPASSPAWHYRIESCHPQSGWLRLRSCVLRECDMARRRFQG